MVDIIKQKSHRDPIQHELENSSFATTTPPSLPRTLHPLNEINPKTIPQSFLDLLLEVITKTIEKVLSDVLAHSIAQGVEEKIRPLTNELTLLRIAIEGDWNDGKRRERLIAGEEKPE